jgi:hypothetical protein
MARPNHFADLSERPATSRRAEGGGPRRGAKIDELIRLHRSQREANTSEPLIWAGLGLLLVLIFSMLLTTHWFPT